MTDNSSVATMADLEFEFVKCGTCEGCKLMASIASACAEITASFAPKIEARLREIAEVYDIEERRGSYPGEPYSWRERAAEMTRLSRRALTLLREEHWRRLSWMAEPGLGVTCLNLVIRSRAA